MFLNKSDILFESLNSRNELKKEELEHEILETRQRLKYLYKKLYLENKKEEKKEIQQNDNQDNNNQDNDVQNDNNKQDNKNNELTDEEKFVVQLLKTIKKNESKYIKESSLDTVVPVNNDIKIKDKVSLNKSNSKEVAKPIKNKNDKVVSIVNKEKVNNKKGFVQKLAELFFGDDYAAKKVLKSNNLNPEQAILNLDSKLTKLIDSLYNNKEFKEYLYNFLSKKHNLKSLSPKNLSVKVVNDKNNKFKKDVIISVKDKDVDKISLVLTVNGKKPRFFISLFDSDNNKSNDSDNNKFNSKFPVDIKHINNYFELNITDDDKKKLMILSASLIG